MEFEVCYEFAVNRRMPWEGDLETLQNHVTAVREHIDSETAVERVSAQTDLSSAQLAIDIHMFGTNRQTVEADARRIVADAIRAAGAYHQGLYPANEEARMSPKLNSWSGLRTPTWRVRRSSLQFRQQSRVTAQAS